MESIHLKQQFGLKKKFNFNFKQNKKYLIKPIFGSQGKNIVF